MKILVHIATRGRGFEWCMKWYLETNLPDSQLQFLISLDNDDHQDIPSNLGLYNFEVVTGNPSGKISAMNRGISERDWDLLIVGSDDMVPSMGYDQTLASAMQSNFPDLDGCLWTPTEDAVGHTRSGGKIKRNGDAAYLKGWICMLPIMGRKYYDRFGYVYHPSYKSFWCDNEQTEVARRLGKVKYIDQQLFVHKHPAWHPDGKDDELYQKANPDFKADMRNFEKRKAHGFYLT